MRKREKRDYDVKVIVVFPAGSCGGDWGCTAHFINDQAEVNPIIAREYSKTPEPERVLLIRGCGEVGTVLRSRSEDKE